MDKRDWATVVSLLVIPGAGMELYESAGRLFSEHGHLTTGWDYAKLFFLGVALIAAVVELFHRLTHVIDGASAALLMAGAFFYSAILGSVLVARGLLGYGWSMSGFEVVGGLLILAVIAGLLFAVSQEHHEREKAERDRRLAEIGGPEAVAKAHSSDAMDMAETRAFIQTMGSIKA
jgi:small neutral amino acid transporter SnatA (MarC family)